MSQPLVLQTSSNLGSLSVQKAPPLGFARPAPLGAKRSSSIAVKEWNGVTTANWAVGELDLVPVDFPLERTHREIHGVDAAEVASRISKSLCILSIEAEYDDKNAKCKCRTNDLVSFRIRLFAGGDGGLPVVVEVQRRSGSASSFMRSCRSILDAAEGLEVCSEKKLPIFMKRPVGGMKCLQSVPMKSDPIADMAAGLDKSMELLRSKHRDSNLLGLENLCHLTDALKTRPDIASMASKIVILGEQQKYDIREEVAVMLQRDVFTPEEFDEDDTPTTFGEKSRHLTLVLFSNSLAMTSKDGSLASGVKTQKWFADFLIPSLLDEVKSCSISSSNAYEAACGLNSLASCSEVARRLMAENSAVEDLQAAHAYGLQRHELLANETERCLTCMGSSI
jgi:hypothetical protein